MEEKAQTILFADICGSTRLYEVLGDLKGRSTVARCLRVMSEATGHFGGRVIKTIGDEIMAVFDSPDAAAEAACEMQERTTDTMVVDGNRVLIRVGFHHGRTLIDESDIFGDAVNIASRIAARAKAGEILTTSGSTSSMTSTWQPATRHVDRAVIRGKQGEVDLYEVLWKEEDVTRVDDTGPEGGVQFRNGDFTLNLACDNRAVVVCDSRPAVAMGRSDQNDLVIKHNLISRLHARIELRRGNFLLVDQSINGTYVRFDSGEELFVRRESLPIRGAGLIGLGQSVREDTPEAVRFSAGD